MADYLLTVCTKAEVASGKEGPCANCTLEIHHLVHACVATVAALTDSRQSQTLHYLWLCATVLLAQAHPMMLKHLSNNRVSYRGWGDTGIPPSKFASTATIGSTVNVLLG